MSYPTSQTHGASFICIATPQVRARKNTHSHTHNTHTHTNAHTRTHHSQSRHTEFGGAPTHTRAHRHTHTHTLSNTRSVPTPVSWETFPSTVLSTPHVCAFGASVAAFGNSLLVTCPGSFLRNPMSPPDISHAFVYDLTHLPNPIETYSFSDPGVGGEASLTDRFITLSGEFTYIIDRINPRTNWTLPTIVPTEKLKMYNDLVLLIPQASPPTLYRFDAATKYVTSLCV